MAVTRPTPKDIGSYEAKLIGPFTQRQVVCLGAGIIPSVIACWALKVIGVDAYLMIVVVVTIMLIPCILAFGKKFTYGQNPEDFFKDYLYYHVKCSQVRLFEVESFDDVVYQKPLVDKNNEGKEIEKGRYEKYLNKDKYRSYIHKKDRRYNEL